MKAFVFFALPLLAAAAVNVKVYDTVDLTNVKDLTSLPLAKGSTSAPVSTNEITDCYPRPSPGDRKIVEENYRKAEARYNATTMPDSSDDRQASNYGNGLLNQYNFCEKYVAVPTHFVFVYFEDAGAVSRDNGYFTRDQVLVEMDVLYQKLRMRGVWFQLTTIRPYKFTTRAAWEAYKVPITAERTEAKSLSQLVRGDFSTRSLKDLFIYSVFETSPGNAGFASIPDLFPTDNNMLLTDGVFVSHQYLVGHSNYMQGLLSHEIGHWMNLYHTHETFDNTFGCGGSGDYVTDTIPWLSSSGGQDHLNDFTLCPAFTAFNGYKDPCPNQNPPWITQESLRAAATNVMSYSHDYCRERFTPGQIKRIMTSLQEFRGFSYGC